jgi:cell division protein FtsB
MMSWLRRIAVVAVIATIGIYAVVALRGPQGMAALFNKRHEIRTLEEQNANLERENQLKRDRIQRLQNSPSEQEMVIRQQLKLLRPGETSFILRDPPQKAPDATAPSAAQ